ncbi:hypothetical protein [Pseudobacteroides cellulosolvens]|uniref:Uncharacterized protein n=1 Tax=Pseudobacteroides cellulosolvens ATCC 35603 = DSM 2933 TaxID=398512 RepID=A0A0L6JGZ3_9FIRM|nr:hypothetical protein [Pseudobacteroides cellulosolvens]KNY24980.1 hypothetical protein Bccel_0237 [Pseudobacteroides cellulosolvens ATCC 35603 = DSM 2933]
MEKVNNKNIDLTKGIYIPSIECNWLYKAYKDYIDYENKKKKEGFKEDIKDKKDNNYIVEEKYLDKLLNCKIDWSFELMENNILLDKINIIEVKETKKNKEGIEEEVVVKLYTLDIVNVKYTKKYKNKTKKMKKNKKGIEKEVIVNYSKSTKQLRDWSYESGFVFNGKKMTNWKRSGGKARIGEDLFILDSIVSECLDWSRMDLKFNNPLSIAAIRAYESLPLSSAFTSIDIPEPHKSILVIDDFNSKFSLNMSQTWLENKELHTATKLTEESNSIWDGQGLLSNEIFNSNELTIGHGNMLLRNRLTKINGISCKIELYYRDYCEANGLDYDTFTVKDIAGRTIYVKDILLITTPSALKIEKFNDRVLEEEGYKQYGKHAWLYYYLDNCGNRYAVCKVDKPSKYEDGKNVLSYQMVNTIPFSKEQLSELVKPEIAYVEKLKDDLNFFLAEVNKNIEDDEDTLNFEKIENLINDDDNKIRISKNTDVTGAFTVMCKHNPNFANTSVFKEFRRSFIKAYVEELRQGKIKISGDYCIANGNVIEMLKATTGDFDGKTSTLKCNQIFCSRFKENELVVGFRNPHVNISNIGTHIVVNVPEIRRYFACTANQVFLNSIDYPTLSLYQGEDFDIDSNLITNEPCIIDACLNVDKTVTAISVNKIKESDSNKQELTPENMSKVDHIISKNYIGDVINLSQEINSKFNHYKYNKINTDKLGLLFDLSSRCSSMSCCEIDKAKKSFEDLNINKEIKKIKNTEGLFDLVDKELDTRRIKPYFFKFIGDNKAKKQRRISNRKHREKIDLPIIINYCKENKIEIIKEIKDNGKIKYNIDKIKELKKNDIKLKKLLKDNDKIQEEWEDKMYDKLIDTPMNWLELELDNIKDAESIPTMQVIQLIKKSHKVANEQKVNKVIEAIKALNDNIKNYKTNDNLVWMEKVNKIKQSKLNTCKEIKKIKLNKADLSGILIEGLNSIKKNKKIDTKSSIESILLEILFQVYGIGLLTMFKNGGDSQEEKEVKTK